MDARSDLYSLGVCFYEWLTGRPPFITEDPLELIHSHIARPPQPPAEARPELPEVVSRIVLKLLAKRPEDRYQTALGVQRDLERCRAELSSTGSRAPSPSVNMTTGACSASPTSSMGETRS